MREMEHLWCELLIEWQLDFAVELDYSDQDHKTNFLQYLLLIFVGGIMALALKAMKT